jgi:hypothetical protein
MRVRSGGDASGPHARSDGVGGTGPAWARETQAQAGAFFFEHGNLQRGHPGTTCPVPQSPKRAATTAR